MKFFNTLCLRPAILILTLLCFSCNDAPPAPEVYPGDPLVDIDGNEYPTLIIGNQVWMAQNLRVTHFRDGTSLANLNDPAAWSSGLWNSGYCYVNNSDSNLVNFGALYTGATILDSRAVAPEGWHIPRDDEWKELEIYLGMSRSEADKEGYRGAAVGQKLKSRDGWEDGSPEEGILYPIGYQPPHYAGNGNDDYGFSIYPTGDRHSGNGLFYGQERYAYFWTTTKAGTDRFVVRTFGYYSHEIERGADYRYKGFSIRCVKDPD